MTTSLSSTSSGASLFLRHAARVSQVLSIVFSILWLCTLLAPPSRYTCWHYEPGVALVGYNVGLLRYTVTKGVGGWLGEKGVGLLEEFLRSPGWRQKFQEMSGTGDYWMIKQRHQNCMWSQFPLGKDWCSMWTRLEYASYGVMGCTALAITMFSLFGFYLVRKKGMHRRTKEICLCMAPLLTMLGHGMYYFLTWDFPVGKLTEDGQTTFGYCFWIAMALDIGAFSAMVAFVNSDDYLMRGVDSDVAGSPYAISEAELLQAARRLQSTHVHHPMSGSHNHRLSSSRLHSSRSQHHQMSRSESRHSRGSLELGSFQQFPQPSGFQASFGSRPSGFQASFGSQVVMHHARPQIPQPSGHQASFSTPTMMHRRSLETPRTFGFQHPSRPSGDSQDDFGLQRTFVS